MPRQNRVTPFGALVAVPERGTLMGNRGVLHDAEGRIRRRWTTRAWIACALRFKGRRRAVMTPSRYTELFFLDEATALAAGHRPCAECRRADFLRFRVAWLAGNSEHGLAPGARIAELDRVLHAERIDGPGRTARGRTWRAPLATLPDGAMVVRDGEPDVPRLVWSGGLQAWSFGGYGPHEREAADATVTVVTPPSIVAAIRAGYAPSVHPSADRGAACYTGRTHQGGRAMRGTVEGIFTTPGAGQPMVSHPAATAVAGRGLVGDRYHDRVGYYSERPSEGGGREVTLIEAEELDRLRAERGIELTPLESRRNVVTRGIRLLDLIGRRFRVGEVVCEGVKICEPCAYLEELTGKAVNEPLVHRAGLRANVLVGGTLRVGDAVEAVEAVEVVTAPAH